MEKVSFSIPSGSGKPQSKPEAVSNTFNDGDGDGDGDGDVNFSTNPNSTITIPPLQNQWKPQQHTSLQFRRTPTESEVLRKHKLKNDLQSLPEDQGFQEFSDVPVSRFGAAVLGGYGWTKGMGIGKNAKEDVKVVQFKRANAGHGLGFNPSQHHHQIPSPHP